jgi:hypothetical protein
MAFEVKRKAAENAMLIAKEQVNKIISIDFLLFVFICLDE